MRYFRQYKKSPRTVKWKYVDPSRHIVVTGHECDRFPVHEIFDPVLDVTAGAVDRFKQIARAKPLNPTRTIATTR
jgi:hypothetical protein